MLMDGAGGTLLDATIPGGAYSSATKAGWTKNGASTKFKYRNGSASLIGGIKSLLLASNVATPGTLKATVRGKRGSYAVAAAQLPVKATLVIDPPTASTGQCGESQFSRASCKFNASGSDLTCQ
jgi:hypothetical protein